MVAHAKVSGERASVFDGHGFGRSGTAKRRTDACHYKDSRKHGITYHSSAVVHKGYVWGPTSGANGDRAAMADMVRGNVDEAMPAAMAKSGEQTTFEAVFQSMPDSNGRHSPRKVCVEDMTRKYKPILVSNGPKATLSEKLDEA